MSEIIEALTEYQQHYMGRYQQATVEYSKKYQPSAAEVLFEISGRDDLPYLFRLYRADLASAAVDPPNLTEVNLEKVPEGKAITSTINGVTIELSPLAWNGVEFTGASFDPANPLFNAWMSAWIDIDEKKTTNEHGLGGYVHSVTYPEKVSESSMSFSVDFGSAEPRALIELINVMSEIGAPRLSVNSNWLASDPST